MDFVKDELDCFHTTNGVPCYFIAFKGRTIACWTETEKASHGSYDYVNNFLDITMVDEENLKRLNIWDNLTEQVQKEINNQKEVEKNKVIEKMAHARQHCKRKYNFAGLPDILTCSCGKTSKPNYYALQKLADERKISLADLIKEYKCRKCKNKDNKHVNLPEFMECKCGNKVKANYYYLKSKADKLGVTIEKLIEDFRCQTCAPTKGRKKKNKTEVVKTKVKGGKRGRQKKNK